MTETKIATYKYHRRIFISDSWDNRVRYPSDAYYGIELLHSNNTFNIKMLCDLTIQDYPHVLVDLEYKYKPDIETEFTIVKANSKDNTVYNKFKKYSTILIKYKDDKTDYKFCPKNNCEFDFIHRDVFPPIQTIYLPIINNLINGICLDFALNEHYSNSSDTLQHNFPEVYELTLLHPKEIVIHIAQFLYGIFKSFKHGFCFEITVSNRRYKHKFLKY